MNAPLLILYGSQTGNAQDVAERLAREAQILLFRPRVLAMDSYDVTHLPNEHLVICVASTTGQGEPPDNMKRFWRFLLRKSLPTSSLSKLRTAVFGLGDSGYPGFNVAAKKLARRLEALGARPLIGMGLGDDQHPSGYEAALDTWCAALWPLLRAEAGPLPEGIQQPVLDEASLLQLGKPKYTITLLSPDQAHAALAARHAHAHTPTSDWQAVVCAGFEFKSVAAAAAGGLQSTTEQTPETNGHGGSMQPHANSNGQGTVSVGMSQVGLQQGSMLPDPNSSGHGAEAVGVAAQGAQQGCLGPAVRYASVVENRRVTAASHFQDTRHVVLDLGSPACTYDPGDVLAVLPEQSDAHITSLLTRLDLNGDQWVCVTPSPDSPGGTQAAGAVQCVATIRLLVKGALDVSSASPRRYFFQVLRAFAGTDLERERLAYFASSEGRDELYRYCKREGRSVLEVLTDFKSCSLPLEWLLETCPPLTPRHFSIASSCRMHPGQAHLLVAVVEYKTPYKRTIRGLCSSYLASLPAKGSGAPGTEQGSAPQVACWIERGSMRMPQDLTRPLILVGPGTGVAPFRAFLEERWALLNASQQQQAATHDNNDNTSSSGESSAQQRAASAGVAPCQLFFGCRSEQADFYFMDEWRAMQEAGVLDTPPAGLVVAFSRDQESKVYVTHKIREHGPTLWQLLEQQGASVYVSGSAQKMPRQVSSAFRDVVQEQSGCDAQEAARYVKQLELTGRYSVEAWS